MDSWPQVRIAAGVMLAVYVGIAAVLSFRELRFLASVEPRRRRWFAAQDIAVQLAIIGVLLPCTIAPAPTTKLFVVIMVAFTMLWIAALWALISRSMYTYRLMLEARGERKQFMAGALPAAPGERRDGAASPSAVVDTQPSGGGNGGPPAAQQ